MADEDNQQLRKRTEQAEAALAEAVALLGEAYEAMREPTGDWHDDKCNRALPSIRAFLARHMEIDK